MIVVPKFRAKNIHMFVAKDHEMVQAFLLNALNKSLDVGNCIWRSKSSSLRFDLCFGERCEKRFGVFAVVVMHKNLARYLDLLGMFDECFGLLDHPSFVRFVGRWCDEDTSSLHIQEDQNEDVSKTGFGDDLLGEKIALPHGFCMACQKLIPGSRSSIGAGLVTVTFEDFLDRVSGDGLDSKFSKLS